MGSDSGERGLKVPSEVVGDSQKQDTKNQQELIQWHNRCIFSIRVLVSIPVVIASNFCVKLKEEAI